MCTTHSKLKKKMDRKTLFWFAAKMQKLSRVFKRILVEDLVDAWKNMISINRSLICNSVYIIFNTEDNRIHLHIDSYHST